MEKLLYFVFIVQLALCSGGRLLIDSSYKLPNNVKPIRYTLTMEPEMDVNIAAPTFNGSVIIELKSVQTSNRVTVNARRLNISENSIKLVSNDGSELKLLNTSVDTDREFFTIFFADELLEGQYYNLSIGEFIGFMKYDNTGFYFAKYTNEHGVERHAAITDFEPIDARKAFPCFDEPAMKATFIINLIRSENYTSVSNEDLLFTEQLEDGRFKDTYKETALMSTYVVAFAVFDFKHTPRKERHRVFARAEAIDSGKLDYALSEAVKILQILEEFTGINYTLSKMDQIAVPDKYFNDEAMENWGLVTFSEKHLFISNKTSKTEDIQRCTSYISHEFGHQWFGNMVTFKDWKYLWLSEGFGTFMQNYITSLAKPSWRYMDQFVVSTIHPIFTYDVTHDAEPLNYQPKYLGAIPSPWICYYKGSSVIRMIQHVLTTPVFTRGLQIYLQKNKFSAVEPSDLYQAFQEAVDEAGVHHLLGNNSISTIMETWDSSGGYPLITVTSNYENGSVTITQSRYSEDSRTKNDTIWYIPISYAVQSDISSNFSDTTPNLWLTEETTVIDGNFTSDEWLIINKQQTGFYRVNYDLDNWQKLASFLNTNNYKTIHVINRAQLLFDSFGFAECDLVPYDVPLNLSTYLSRETDYIAITPFVEALSYLNRMMTYSEMYSVFQTYVINLLSTAYDYLGFDEKPTDTNLDKLNRIQVLKWMCRFGHGECRNKALQKLRDWKESGTLSVTPNLESTILCNAIRNAGLEEWEFLYNKSIINSVNKKHYFEALSCSEDKNVLNGFLQKIFNNKTQLNNEDRATSLSSITSNKVGLDVVLQFVKDNEDLPKRAQANIAYHLGLRTTTEAQLAQLKALNSTRDGQFNYGIKIAQVNIDWLNKDHKKQIEDWLLSYTLENQENTNIILVS